MFKDKRKTIKTVVGLVAGITAGSLVQLALKQNVAVTKTSEKVALAIGSFMIGDYVGGRISDYAEASIDGLFDSIDTIKTSMTESAQPSEDILIAAPEQTE